MPRKMWCARESVASPRAYVYEANRNYILSDFWLDDENELLGGFINLYGSGSLGRVMSAARLPLFEQTRDLQGFCSSASRG